MTWNELKGKSHRTDCWEDLLSDLMQWGGKQIIYRGQGNSEWVLSCTLARRLDELTSTDSELGLLLHSAAASEKLDDFIQRSEARMLRFFMDRAEELGISVLPSGEDRLAWWEMMQHHGAPTRLLDWTRSPFIALWFAVSDDHFDDDSALWVFDTRSSSNNYQPDIAELDREALDARTWQNRLADRAIEKRAQVPVVIEANRYLPRAVAQQSVVTLIPHPGSSLSMGAFLFGQLAVKVPIPITWKAPIARALLSMGISRSSLFMDLDSTGAELSMTLGMLDETGH